MKKTIILIITTIMILSFAACASPAVQETQTQQTEAASPTLVPTAQPTASPTPEPTPTPVVLTDEEQEYLEYLEYLPQNDLFAEIILLDALNNNKLDNLIDLGQVNEEQIALIEQLSNYFLFDPESPGTIIPEEFVINLEEGNFDGGAMIEVVMILINHDNIDPIEIGYNEIGKIMSSIDVALKGGETFFSAFTGKNKEDFESLYFLYQNITDADNMAKFHEELHSPDLSPLVQYTIASYISNYNSVREQVWDPAVTYEGEDIHFSQYAIAYCMNEKAEADLYLYLGKVYVEGLPREEFEPTTLDDYDLPPAIEATR